jgi:ATP-dependent helicase YprA (DUF1998 family)
LHPFRPPLAAALDLLSVTTTMEAGVDIGDLSAIVMANMPPTRFNYQQRVGRADRRGAPVAVALTVCRGRRHDEYYFDRPDLITNEPTPACRGVRRRGGQAAGRQPGPHTSTTGS